MTDKVLDDYYKKHYAMYHMFVTQTTSVPELLLKIEMYGKKWNRWDWVLLFATIIDCKKIKYVSNRVSDYFVINNQLLDDIKYAIDNSTDFDKIMTDKQVVLSIIHVINCHSAFFKKEMRIILCQLLGHIFKKFPKMWSLSWMFAKSKDYVNKKWIKYHRLAKITPCSYNTKVDRLYSIFIKEFYDKKEIDKTED